MELSVRGKLNDGTVIVSQGNEFYKVHVKEGYATPIKGFNPHDFVTSNGEENAAALRIVQDKRRIIG